jgi:hypothetical protein
MSELRNKKVRVGATLILVGLVLFVLLRTDLLAGSTIPLVLGAAFLVAYLVQRRHGFLIPGSILLGLGLGQGLEDWFSIPVQGVQLGLGLGFLAIFVIALLYERRSHWWPLIPGGILTVLAFPRTENIASYLFENWPLILVVIGVVILLGALGKGKGSE